MTLPTKSTGATLGCSFHSPSTQAKFAAIVALGLSKQLHVTMTMLAPCMQARAITKKSRL